MKGLFVAWGCSSFCFSAPGWLVAHADHVCSCAMLCFGFLQLWTMKKFARPLLQPQTRRSSKCEVMWPNLVKPSEPLRPPWRCGVLEMVWWCGLLLDNTMCSGTGRNAAQCDERREPLDRIAPPRKGMFACAVFACKSLLQRQGGVCRALCCPTCHQDMQFASLVFFQMF